MSEEPKKDENKSNRSEFADQVLTTLFAILGAGGLFLLIGTLTMANFYASETGNWGWGSGQFGDAFGFVTSIFTGAAYLGLWLTMRYQRKELSEVKAERKLAQETFVAQQALNELTKQELEKRGLEDRIFKLIDRVETKTQRLKKLAAKPSLVREAEEAIEKVANLAEKDSASTMIALSRLLGQPKRAYLELGCSEIHTALRSMQSANLSRDLEPILFGATDRRFDAVIMAFALLNEFLSEDGHYLFLVFTHRNISEHLHADTWENYNKALKVIGTYHNNKEKSPPAPELTD